MSRSRLFITRILKFLYFILSHILATHKNFSLTHISGILFSQTTALEWCYFSLFTTACFQRVNISGSMNPEREAKEIQRLMHFLMQQRRNPPPCQFGCPLRKHGLGADVEIPAIKTGKKNNSPFPNTCCFCRATERR